MTTKEGHKDGEHFKIQIDPYIDRDFTGVVDENKNLVGFKMQSVDRFTQSREYMKRPPGSDNVLPERSDSDFIWPLHLIETKFEWGSKLVLDNDYF